ncbi:cytochrome P450 [Roridomyces roridus]|uniref:Cytochrome P450 n=1 Tax=Roridomyces roridus TaxID=1738132 RepID=A0AAD7CEP2_9AGAR|nr:cytochrome P450 [Roridomyces roridus]
MLIKLAVSLLGTIAAYAVYHIGTVIYRESTSPTRALPGPNSSHFFYGNQKDIWKGENSLTHEGWIQKYGRTFRYFSYLNASRLFTTDTKALNHFLTNSYIYQRPQSSRYNLGRIVGPGVLVTEGDQHKMQRRIMNPAFGAAQVRELTGIFLQKSLELRDVWQTQASLNADGTARVNALSWLSKATLDIIGLAGFNYDFNALSSEDDANTEFGTAFATVYRVGLTQTPLRIIKTFVPALRFIPSKTDALIEECQATMMQIGRKLLQQSKDEMAGDGTFEKGSGRTIARDLLSLLVRANTAKDIPAHQRLSDEDVLAQVPTFLVAGHETTSTGTTWALFALTQNITAQNRLREELLRVDTDTPTMEELNELPYLDAVVRETLRVHAPVVGVHRVATQDDIVPLATPYTDRKGVVHDTLRIQKGQIVYIPILVMNRDKEIWGPDATEFKPERWLEDRAMNNSIPGIWGHMLSFLGGPRACIGYRFALVEMKALLFTLIRAFEFSLGVPASDIGSRTAIVQRPILRSEPKGGNQLPIVVRAYGRDSEDAEE